jgi:hypothetical protein
MGTILQDTGGCCPGHCWLSTVQLRKLREVIIGTSNLRILLDAVEDTAGYLITDTVECDMDASPHDTAEYLQLGKLPVRQFRMSSPRILLNLAQDTAGYRQPWILWIQQSRTQTPGYVG